MTGKARQFMAKPIHDALARQLMNAEHPIHDCASNQFMRLQAQFMTSGDDTSSVILGFASDATRLSCGLGQVAALTAHRAVIHCRALRFATLKGKASDARFSPAASLISIK